VLSFSFPLLTCGTKKWQQRDIDAARAHSLDYKQCKHGPTLRRQSWHGQKSFQTLVHRQAKTDKKFAEALLREGIDAILSGDMETGKTILRDTIKATIGFEKLGEATGASPKSLIRVFGPRGNPQARILFNVIGYLQKRAGLQFHVAR
jgi:DNA-binding phage protein